MYCVKVTDVAHALFPLDSAALGSPCVMYTKTMSEVTLGACPSTMGWVAVGHSGILPVWASVDTVSQVGQGHLGFCTTRGRVS